MPYPREWQAAIGASRRSLPSSVNTLAAVASALAGVVDAWRVKLQGDRATSAILLSLTMRAPPDNSACLWGSSWG